MLEWSKEYLRYNPPRHDEEKRFIQAFAYFLVQYIDVIIAEETTQEYNPETHYFTVIQNIINRNRIVKYGEENLHPQPLSVPLPIERGTKPPNRLTKYPEYVVLNPVPQDFKQNFNNYCLGIYKQDPQELTELSELNPNTIYVDTAKRCFYLPTLFNYFQSRLANNSRTSSTNNYPRDYSNIAIPPDMLLQMYHLAQQRGIIIPKSVEQFIQSPYLHQMFELLPTI